MSRITFQYVPPPLSVCPVSIYSKKLARGAAPKQPAYVSALLTLLTLVLLTCAYFIVRLRVYSLQFFECNANPSHAFLAYVMTRARNQR